MDAQLGLFDDTPTPGVTPVAPAPFPEELSTLAKRLPPNLRLGTSSWSFPGWEGLVYDRKASETTLARYGLAAYARHPLLRTVGVDRGFYRPVPLEDFRAYADDVPEDFRFLVKADRILTSPTDPGATALRGSNPYFLDATWAIDQVVGPMMEGLGVKAGPLLFQFPPLAPNLVGGADVFAQRLHGFLDALPPGPLYSVELRTPALLTPEYVKALEAVQAAHCYTVHPAMSSLEEQLKAVRPFEQPALVVRWMLHAGLKYEVAKERYEPFDRIVDEDADSLERITRAAFDALIAERGVFVVVNNKAEGSSPLSVIRLARSLARWEPPPPSDAAAGPEPAGTVGGGEPGPA